MTTADFKAKIARIMRERETGKKYSIIGASRADECVVRKPQKKFVDKINSCGKMKRENEGTK